MQTKRSDARRTKAVLFLFWTEECTQAHFCSSFLFRAYTSNIERRGVRLRKEKIIYLTAFLFGVIVTNILESKSWINVDYLHRHQLLQLSYSEIRYERYLIELLFQRLRMVGLLWLLGKVIPSGWIRLGVGGIFCMTLGSILTSTILANGVWGLLLFFGMLFPQWIFYTGAFVWWGSFQNLNYRGKYVKKNVLLVLLLILFVVFGCIVEAYVNPFVVYQIIKF